MAIPPLPCRVMRGRLRPFRNRRGRPPDRARTETPRWSSAAADPETDGRRTWRWPARRAAAGFDSPQDKWVASLKGTALTNPAYGCYKRPTRPAKLTGKPEQERQRTTPT